MLPDRMFTTFQTASQAMAIQREKIAVASRNIANANTSAPEGASNVYRPQTVVTSVGENQDFLQLLQGSINSLRTTNDKHTAGSPMNMGPSSQVVELDHFRYEYDPQHPDSDENGMVRYPDVDVIREMVQMVSANRLYEANISVIEAEKQMIRRSLEI